jgi:uncharacterized coiled-coil protein SlyX
MPRTRTIQELRAELAAREKQVAKLQAQRQRLARQLDQLGREMAAMSGGQRRAPAKVGRKAAAQRRRKLPRNVKPLVEYIRDALAGAEGGMRVKDVMVAVRKAGYKTFSKEFYGQVAAAVREGPFAKVSRGVYRLKAAKKAGKPKAAPKGAAQ